MLDMTRKWTLSSLELRQCQLCGVHQFYKICLECREILKAIESLPSSKIKKEIK